MSKEVIIYSNTGCSRCMLLKRWLQMKQINYQERNISQDSQALMLLKENNLKQLPQIQIDGTFIQFAEYNDILQYI